MVPNLFYAVAHLPLSAERRGPPSQNNRKIHCLHLGTNMSKKNMCFTITHQILFNFSISNKKQTARGTSLRFLLLCDGFDKTVNSWLRYGKSASKIVFWRKVESVLIFSLHVRKVQNSDSHKYVLGKRSNYRRASFRAFGQSSDTISLKSQILLVSNTYFDPDLFRRSISSSFRQSITFSTGATKRFFTKSKFVLMISGK